MAEIKKRYFEQLELKYLQSCQKIDDILIKCYKFLIEHKRIEIHKRPILGVLDNDYIQEDLIKKIQQHYSKNWNVTYIDKNQHVDKNEIFVFSYKNDLSTDIQESKVIDKENQTDRYSILDI